MPSKCSLGGIALVSLFVAGCDSVTPAKNTGPVALTPGTVEYQLRQQQLQNARSGANPGIQNPAVTGVNPSVSGIERAGPGGAGSTGGTVGGLRTDGTVDRPGAGAPASQTMVPANPRRPAPAY
jgi:hypothetical protein